MKEDVGFGTWRLGDLLLGLMMLRDGSTGIAISDKSRQQTVCLTLEQARAVLPVLEECIRRLEEEDGDET